MIWLKEPLLPSAPAIQKPAWLGLACYYCLLVCSLPISEIQLISFGDRPGEPAKLAQFGSGYCSRSPINFFHFYLVLGNALGLLASLFSSIFIHSILQLIAAVRGIAFVQADALQLTKQLQFGSSFLILAIAGCVLYSTVFYAKWRLFSQIRDILS